MQDIRQATCKIQDRQKKKALNSIVISKLWEWEQGIKCWHVIVKLHGLFLALSCSEETPNVAVDNWYNHMKSMVRQLQMPMYTHMPTCTPTHTNRAPFICIMHRSKGWLHMTARPQWKILQPNSTPHFPEGHVDNKGRMFSLGFFSVNDIFAPKLP